MIPEYSTESHVNSFITLSQKTKQTKGLSVTSYVATFQSKGEK